MKSIRKHLLIVSIIAIFYTSFGYNAQIKITQLDQEAYINFKLYVKTGFYSFKEIKCKTNLFEGGQVFQLDLDKPQLHYLKSGNIAVPIWIGPGNIDLTLSIDNQNYLNNLIISNGDYSIENTKLCEALLTTYRIYYQDLSYSETYDSILKLQVKNLDDISGLNIECKKFIENYLTNSSHILNYIYSPLVDDTTTASIKELLKIVNQCDEQDLDWRYLILANRIFGPKESILGKTPYSKDYEKIGKLLVYKYFKTSTNLDYRIKKMKTTMPNCVIVKTYELMVETLQKQETSEFLPDTTVGTDSYGPLLDVYEYIKYYSFIDNQNKSHKIISNPTEKLLLINTISQKDVYAGKYLLEQFPEIKLIIITTSQHVDRIFQLVKENNVKCEVVYEDELFDKLRPEPYCLLHKDKEFSFNTATLLFNHLKK